MKKSESYRLKTVVTDGYFGGNNRQLKFQTINQRQPQNDIESVNTRHDDQEKLTDRVNDKLYLRIIKQKSDVEQLISDVEEGII
jgi:hypothetical protein